MTGFQPFGGYKWNPTEESTRNFHELGDVDGVELIGMVLPCTYYGAFKLFEKPMRHIKPDGVINTGLASSVKGLQIETMFRNMMKGKYSAADGLNPNGSLINDDLFAPSVIESTGDSARLFRILQENGIPSRLSNDADTFICNSLGYQVSRYITDNHLKTKNIFVHVPWNTNYEGLVELERGKIFMDESQYYTGLTLLIKNLCS